MSNKWLFSCPRSTAVFTTDKILKNREPILRVTHDLVGGDWQCLPGYDFNDEEQPPKVTCLEDIINLDPTIAKLSDLKLNWVAKRDSIKDDWQCSPKHLINFKKLLEESGKYFCDIQPSFDKKLELSEWDRWDYNQIEATLTFSRKGKPIIIAQIQFIGSYSFVAKTWLWSWANSSITKQCKKWLSLFEEFGKENKFKKMYQAEWKAEMQDAWDIAALTLYLIGGLGVFQEPSDDCPAFFLITGFEEINEIK